MRWLHSITASYSAEDVLPLDELKDELDVEHAGDDVLISSHRDSAIQWVEEYTGRFMGPKTVLFVSDQLPSMLPFDPVTSIASLTLGGEAAAGFPSSPGAGSLLLRPANTIWPLYTRSMGEVRATFTAGYPIGTCPPLLVQAAKLMAGIFYDRSRDPEKDEMAVQNLVRSYRTYGIV